MASIPLAPVPENRSSHFVFATSCISQLNRISLVLLDVGLSLEEKSKGIFEPRNFPPTILILGILFFIIF